MTLGAIFDLDGTLIDSYDAHIVAWQAMSAAYGVPVTLEQFQRHFGRRNEGLLRDIWHEAGRGELTDADVERLGFEKEARYRELVKACVPEMDGARALLDALHGAGWRIAVASSAPIENVDFAIDGLKIRGLVDAIVTGGDVTIGKPNPECFLVASKKLGIAPPRCVVVEDAPAGIEAAKAAGMRCVAITSKGHQPEAQRRADLVVSSLREVTPARMERLIASID